VDNQGMGNTILQLLASGGGGIVAPGIEISDDEEEALGAAVSKATPNADDEVVLSRTAVKKSSVRTSQDFHRKQEAERRNKRLAERLALSLSSAAMAGDDEGGIGNAARYVHAH
jgi:hypothetical protein